MSVVDFILWWIYSVYSWFVNLGWKCRRNIPYYYLVSSDGNQHALNERNLGTCDHLLVIYYTTSGIRYRFLPLLKTKGCCSVTILKSAYQSFVEPKKYKLFAVNATIHERVHTINAIEFNLVGNEIFTPTFNLWLCQNYLNIVPSEHIEISYIDESTSICTTKGPMYFEEERLVIHSGERGETESETETETGKETGKETGTGTGKEKENAESNSPVSVDKE
jgi:hypothetical protein